MLEEDLLHSIMRELSMGRGPWIRKMAKVKWDFCCAPKAEGGIGIIDIREMGDRLAAKWILRGMLNPNLGWAWLINSKNHLFHIQGIRKWTALPFITILDSRVGISAKG